MFAAMILNDLVVILVSKTLYTVKVKLLSDTPLNAFNEELLTN